MVILVAYGGSDQDLEFWHERARLHSTWLGLKFESTQLNIKPHEKILLANIYSDNLLNLTPRLGMPNTEKILMLIKQQEIWSLKQFSNQQCYEQATATVDQNATWVAYDVNEASLSLSCGLFAFGQMYYRRGKNSWIISNDLRLLIPRESQDLDPAGWYSLFEFGAVSAPLTLFKSITRVPPGHSLKFSTYDSNVRHFFRPLASVNGIMSGSCSPEEMMENTLSMEIDKIPPGSGLFFSGGIDSGLLAALAKRRRRTDLLLINCDFSGCFDSAFTDVEAQHARHMAQYLEYKFESLRFDIALVSNMLARIGKDYSFVFADYSTVASNLLVHYAADLVKNGGWIVDGTGADGVFLGPTSWKWLKRVYQVPVSVRRPLASLFRYEPIFRNGSKISRYLGTIRQSLEIPPLQAHVILESRLAGIAFKADPQSVNEVLQGQKDYLEVFFRGLDERTQFSLFDLVHVGIGRFGAKVYDPLRLHGFRPFFPFLAHHVVKAGYHVMTDTHELQENKRVLKSLLLRDVPYEMVYRPKSGFTPPIGAIFNDHSVKAWITDIVLSPNNPIREFVCPQAMEQLFERIWSGRSVFKEHFNFLWAYVFASLWIDQQVKSYADSRSLS
jgi:asparagine synthase (glutamine-hydrolysing)